MASRFVAGWLEDAADTYEECRKYISGYNAELLGGDIYRASSLFDKAEYHYEQACRMCPSRFAPLEGLMQTYISKADTVAANRIADIILKKDVKVQSYDVSRIKKIASEFINNQE